jgi:Tfp pilus assembly protein PilO
VSRTYRILIVAVVAVGAVGGYWKLLLAPKRHQATELSSQIAVAQAKLSQDQGTLAHYQQAKAQYKANYATVVGLGKAVPADDDTRSLVVQLDASAKRSGVAFDNIDVAASGAAPATGATATGAATKVTPGAVNVGSYSVLPFTFSFAGGFDGLSNFFSRLERFVTVDGKRIEVNGRLLRIESVSLQPAAGGWPAIQAQVGAATYLMPTPAAGTAASTAATSSTATPSPSTPTTTAGDLR